MKIYVFGENEYNVSEWIVVKAANTSDAWKIVAKFVGKRRLQWDDEKRTFQPEKVPIAEAKRLWMVKKVFRPKEWKKEGLVITKELNRALRFH